MFHGVTNPGQLGGCPATAYYLNRRQALAPVVHTKDGTVFANSRDVAAYFGKEHRNVLRDIRITLSSNLSAVDFNRMFTEVLYRDPTNRALISYDMTRDGFTLLVMGYTGPKAMQFKVRYIQAFNEMEAKLKAQAQQTAIPQSFAEALRLAADQAQALEEKQARIDAMQSKADVGDVVGR